MALHRLLSADASTPACLLFANWLSRRPVSSPVANVQTLLSSMRRHLCLHRNCDCRPWRLSPSSLVVKLLSSSTLAYVIIIIAVVSRHAVAIVVDFVARCAITIIVDVVARRAVAIIINVVPIAPSPSSLTLSPVAPSLSSLTMARRLRIGNGNDAIATRATTSS